MLTAEDIDKEYQDSQRFLGGGIEYAIQSLALEIISLKTRLDKLEYEATREELD